MTVLKIVLTGKMRAGKDEIGAHLTVNHGFTLSIAFGDAPKRIAHEVFPHIERTPKPRALYQFMNVMRDFDPDVWIRHVERSVNWALDSRATSGIVITDARQPNEIEWARANGFTIIRVNASDAIRKQRAELRGDAFTDEDLAHPTEQYIDGFDVDYDVSNDGDYSALIAQVDGIIAELLTLPEN